MEDYQLLTLLWYTAEVRLVNQTVQTPNGPMQLQQEVEVPLYFRNTKEACKFLTEFEGDQVVLRKMWVDKEGGNLQWYYQ